jgi:hypothetical protein
MRCAICAAENPGGARYCIQCGAEQALPTPIAAVAAAVSGHRGHAAVARAANAAQADLPDERDAEPPPRPNVVMAASMREPRDPAPRQRGTQPSSVHAQPAYARGPSQGHLAAFLIVLAFAIAAIAFGAWKMLGGEWRADIRAPKGDQSVMSSFPPEATPSRRLPSASSAPVPAPPSDASAPASQAGATPETRANEDATGEAGVGATAAPTQPIEIRSLPAKPAPRPAHRRAASEKAQPAPQSPPAEAPAPPPVRAPEVAAAPAASVPVVDRWTRMTDELSRCTREDFIARVICGQRVRFRYCEGYWGKVEACPASPTPERGQ